MDYAGVKLQLPWVDKGATANPWDVMSAIPLVFHHLGLAVQGPDKAMTFLRQLGYTIGPTVRDDLQQVYLSLCEHPSMPRVEIVWPTEIKGPLTSMLHAHAELIYHVCYEAHDVAGAMASMVQAVGPIRCVSPPKPAVLFSGRRVSFYLVPGVGLVELLESSPVSSAVAA